MCDFVRVGRLPANPISCRYIEKDVDFTKDIFSTLIKMVPPTEFPKERMQKIFRYVRVWEGMEGDDLSYPDDPRRSFSLTTMIDDDLSLLTR